MTCLEEEQVLALVERRLEPAELLALEQHVDACESCRAWVAQVTRSFFPAPSLPATQEPARPAATELDLRRGTMIGRYMLLETLGAGGMGMVFKAYDPELDRKVAIKLLRPELSALQERLLAEGKAMARLSHPHVLAVHDMGTVGDRVFVALEYVEGQTLAQWIAGTRPHWRAVLDVFIQAAQGLHAAHSVGIVHRDFKPANVLVGNDGRARVADFGLAVEPAQAAGTPKYMAPERSGGAFGDARSDQFSFCVALREALAGQRGVPRRVLGAVERGLARDPAQRWESMEALLAALRQSRRRTLAWVSATAAIAAVAAAAVAPALLAARKAERCARAGPAPALGAARQAFQQSQLGFAADTWKRVEPLLDSYARSLDTEQRHACEAAWVQGQLPEAVLLSRLACLERDRRQLTVLTELFTAPDEELMAKAVEAAAALPAPERCADVTAPEPPGTAEVRRAVAEAHALSAAGRYAQAEQGAAAAVQQALPLHQRAVEAEAELEQARALERLARYDAAESAYERALRAAQAGQADAVAATACTALVRVRGVSLSHVPQGRETAKEAAAWVERAGNEPAPLAELLHAVSSLDRAEGKYAEAAAGDRRAIELREHLLPPEPLAVAESLDALASDLRLSGKFDEALAASRRALELHQKWLGPDHPAGVPSVSNVAVLLSIMNKSDEALEYHRRALDICRRSLPPGHPDTARALLRVGTALFLVGPSEESLTDLDEAIATFKKAGLPLDAATGLVNASQSARLLGKLDRAEKAAREALELRLSIQGKDHPDIGYARVMLGDALVEAHRPAEALPELEQGVAIWESKLGANYADLTDPLVNIGRAQLELGAPKKAVPPLERALVLLKDWPEPRDVAEARFYLAQALWDSQTDRSRAVALAKEAAQVDSAKKSDVEKWIEAHRVP